MWDVFTGEHVSLLEISLPGVPFSIGLELHSRSILL